MTDWSPISLDKITRYALKERPSKVKVQDFAGTWKAGGSLATWLACLPKMLAAADFRDFAARMVQAASSGKTVLMGMGAHPIKVGLNPIIIDLLRRGVITGVAMNGAGIIHDAELAMAGHTSEDVAAELGNGAFGMAEETGRFLNEATKEGARTGMGLGQAVGAMLERERFVHNDGSILANAHRMGIPVTVHVAVGTDIIHFHPTVDGAAIGETSHRDFRLFARIVSTLEEGVFINLGSAVIIPEVFLKALSLVRNLGYPVQRLTTANMDFQTHYRPMTNVVQRPNLEGGKGYHLIGHHEIMFPLLAAAVIEGLEGEGGPR